MALDFTSNTTEINEASNIVSSLIYSKFNEATSYASASVTNAQTALASMAAAFQSLSAVTFTPVDFDPVSPNITSSISNAILDVGTVGTSAFTEDFPGNIIAVSADFQARIDTYLALVDSLLVSITEGNASVEALIYDRARQRQEIQNLAQYTEAETFFSARGFAIPTGALVGKLQEISIEIERNNANLNNDILVEAAKLAQSNAMFVIEKQTSVLLEEMKTTIALIDNYSRTAINEYIAKVDAYKALIQGKLGDLEAQAKAISARADAIKALAYVESVGVEAQVKNAEITLANAKAAAEIAIKNAEVEIETSLRTRTAGLEAYKAAGQIMAQLAASALTSVNASASMGFSGSVSDGYSANVQYTESDSRSTSESESIIHTIDETVST